MEPHPLTGLAPVIITYPEFVSRFKKSVYSINFFMRYSQFKSLVTTRVATPIIDYTHPKYFLSALNFWYQHAKKQTIHHIIYHTDPIFHKFQKPYFWPIFEAIFFHKIWLSCKSSYLASRSFRKNSY